MVMNINAGGSSNPTALTRIGFKLFFAANDGTHGNEIWATDGITTALVQDIEPGAGSSDPTLFTEVNGKVFTSVFNSTYGRELWVGTAPALNSPLPLTLLEFKGSVVNDNGVLQWKTDNELNTKSFAVERSTNGRNFSSVGYVNAANASGVHNYDYTDANLKSLGSSIIYYRLRQVDADNKFTYSRIVALTLDKQKSFAMLYPNPVRKDLNLTITLAKKERLTWQLSDNNGKVVKNGYYELGAGSTAVVIDGGNLSAGNYLLSLNGEQLQQTIKIVKQ
jgi:ELWxxDGT repeat protein